MDLHGEFSFQQIYEKTAFLLDNMAQCHRVEVEQLTEEIRSLQTRLRTSITSASVPPPSPVVRSLRRSGSSPMLRRSSSRGHENPHYSSTGSGGRHVVGVQPFAEGSVDPISAPGSVSIEDIPDTRQPDISQRQSDVSQRQSDVSKRQSDVSHAGRQSDASHAGRHSGQSDYSFSGAYDSDNDDLSDGEASETIAPLKSREVSGDVSMTVSSSLRKTNSEASSDDKRESMMKKSVVWKAASVECIEISKQDSIQEAEEDGASALNKKVMEKEQSAGGTTSERLVKPRKSVASLATRLVEQSTDPCASSPAARATLNGGAKKPGLALKRSDTSQFIRNNHESEDSKSVMDFLSGGEDDDCDYYDCNASQAARVELDMYEFWHSFDDVVWDDESNGSSSDSEDSQGMGRVGSLLSMPKNRTSGESGGSSQNRANQSAIPPTSNSLMPSAMPNTSKLMRASSIIQEAAAETEQRIARKVRSMVVHPCSLKRIIWVIIGAFLIVYDLFLLPLAVFDDHWDVHVLSINEGIFKCGTFFWTFDFLMSFLVGYHTEDAVVTISAEKTMKHYARTWMLFDLILLLVDWIGNFGPRSMSDLKRARVIRLLRLPQFVNLPASAIATSTRVSRSKSAVLFLGILKHLLALLWLNHVIACMWYYIGDGHMHHVHAGWVRYYLGEVLEERGLEFGFGGRYLTSLHWALTQFTPATMEVFPQNVPERLYAVLVLLFALVTFSSFVSSITSLTTHLRHLRSEETRKFADMERYMEDKDLPLALKVRTIKYLKKVIVEQRKNAQEKDIELFAKLSESLQMEILYEIHKATLGMHPVFYHYAQVNLIGAHKLCLTALSIASFMEHDAIYSKGNVAHFMYIIAAGEATYSSMAPKTETNTWLKQQQAKASKAIKLPSQKTTAIQEAWLSAGHCACEAVLWAPWEHRGTLYAVTDCRLILINAMQFHQVVQERRDGLKDLVCYARAAVQAMNETDDISDVDLGFESAELASSLDFVLSEMNQNYKHSTNVGPKKNSRLSAPRYGMYFMQFFRSMSGFVGRHSSTRGTSTTNLTPIVAITRA